MKLNYFLLVSVFVLGYASAKAFPQEPEQNGGDPSNPDNNLFFDPNQQNGDGQNNFVLDGNANGDATTPISLFDSAIEIREYVVSKLGEIYTMLKGLTNKVDIDQATKLDFEHLPKFEDPLDVGNFTKKYKLADVQFSNVKVHGVRNFRSAEVKTDLNKRTIDLYLKAANLRIVGNYFLSNYFKKASGNFIVKLLDNVTYHESSVYCRLKNEVDVATSRCGIRYGKSDNDYANLGFFTQLFRSAISCPMIDEVLQTVGKEIGHKMRPILLSKLHETVMGKTNIPGLETLIRSSVSEARNLMMRDEYQNFLLEGEDEKIQYGTHDATIQSIYLKGINAFEITRLDIPILEGRIIVNATAHNTIVGGTVNVLFVENDVVQERTGGPVTVELPFDIEDLIVDIAFEKQLSNDEDRFAISRMEVTVTKVTTRPSSDQTYAAQVEAALRDFLPIQLKSVISTRFYALARTQIDSILQEAL